MQNVFCLIYKLYSTLVWFLIYLFLKLQEIRPDEQTNMGQNIICTNMWQRQLSCMYGEHLLYGCLYIEDWLVVLFVDRHI